VETFPANLNRAHCTDKRIGILSLQTCVVFKIPGFLPYVRIYTFIEYFSGIGKAAFSKISYRKVDSAFNTARSLHRQITQIIFPIISITYLRIIYAEVSITYGITHLPRSDHVRTHI
jgi:hypothetical protein